MSANAPPDIDANEWASQERGMRAASGADEQRRDLSGVDAAATSYSAIAEALISQLRSEPPGDFAAGVVAAIARRDAGIETLLSRKLLAVFGLASIIVLAVYGSRCWQLLDQEIGSDATEWLLAGTVCLALSWVCGQSVQWMGMQRPRQRSD